MGIISRDECKERVFVPIFYKSIKQTVWYLNNTSYYIYDDRCVKRDSVDHRRKACSTKHRGSKKAFNELILDRLNGDMDVLQLYYGDPCNDKTKDNLRSKLCFNACRVYNKRKFCQKVPDRMYEKLNELLELNENKIGDLLKMGYILCELIPCVENGSLKTNKHLEAQKELVWKMINDFAKEKELFSGIKDQPFNIIDLIAENHALNEMFQYKVDERERNLFREVKFQQMVMQILLEQWLEDVEDRWSYIKDGFNIKLEDDI